MNKYLQLTLFVIATSLTGFCQTENYWVKKADFGGLKRERAVAFTINDYGYVGTGVDTAEIVHKDFWKYDPIADTWSQVADLPGSVRRNAVAFTVQGFGYVGTGVDSVVATAPGSLKYTDFYKYDPTANSWSQIASLPGAGRYFATAFAIDSKGYVCAGKYGPNSYSNLLYEYKPALDQWTLVGGFPGGLRYQLSSFVIGYKAYIGLGTDQDMYRDDIWEFDATTNGWTQVASLPASERSAAMTFSIGQRGFVCMGSNGGYLDDLWEYNPFDDDWTVRATYGGTRRKGGVGFSLNGLGYVGTGKGNSGKKASFQEYHPVAVLGVDELALNVSVYPNPAQEVINVSSSNHEISELKIINTLGREVYRGSTTKSIQVSQLMKGQYYLVASNAYGEVIGKQKFIKQ